MSLRTPAPAARPRPRNHRLVLAGLLLGLAALAALAAAGLGTNAARIRSFLTDLKARAEEEAR